MLSSLQRLWATLHVPRGVDGLQVGQRFGAFQGEPLQGTCLESAAELLTTILESVTALRTEVERRREK